MNYFLANRHSVRKYLDKAITNDLRFVIKYWLENINKESGLNIQAVYDDIEPFKADKTSYKGFSNCKNYFALVGEKNKEEAIGYYGEKLVLLCQEAGLNTCWVRSTYKKKLAKYNKEKGEKLYLVIAFGYGLDQGKMHQSKTKEEVSNVDNNSPDWFKVGVDSALLAPTAMNRQDFYLECKGSKVKVTVPNERRRLVDLGIIKYHFELASGKNKRIWE